MVIDPKIFFAWLLLLIALGCLGYVWACIRPGVLPLKDPQELGRRAWLWIACALCSGLLSFLLW